MEAEKLRGLAKIDYALKCSIFAETDQHWAETRRLIREGVAEERAEAAAEEREACASMVERFEDEQPANSVCRDNLHSRRQQNAMIAACIRARSEGSGS